MNKVTKYTGFGCGVIFILGVALIFFLLFKLNEVIMTGYMEGTPTSVEYHNASDLYKISNIEFPEVNLVDSSYYNDWSYDETTVKFILKNPLDKTELIKKIENNICNDSIYWSKSDSCSYVYYIIPELPIDRPNGTDWRKMENGDLDYEGNFIYLFIPIDNDTITLQYGWKR